MKKILKALPVCLFILAGCGEMDNYGYPRKISFKTDGGTKLISGEECVYSLEITNYNGDGESSNTFFDEYSDSLTVTYEWLTVKCKKNETRLILIAEPNTTGKNRRLYISGFVRNSFADIKVTQ